jgi:hypothetical protein
MSDKFAYAIELRIDEDSVYKLAFIVECSPNLARVLCGFYGKSRWQNLVRVKRFRGSDIAQFEFDGERYHWLDDFGQRKNTWDAR